MVNNVWMTSHVCTFTLRNTLDLVLMEIDTSLQTFGNSCFDFMPPAIIYVPISTFACKGLIPILAMYRQILIDV